MENTKKKTLKGQIVYFVLPECPKILRLCENSWDYNVTLVEWAWENSLRPDSPASLLLVVKQGYILPRI